MTVERGVVAGCIVPHPPLLVPDIGGRELAKVDASVRAMRELADTVGGLEPEVLVVISPHSPFLASSFAVKVCERLEGDFARFGRPRVRMGRPNDLELALKIVEGARARGLPVSPLPPDAGAGPRAGELDHGVLVPLFYLGEQTRAPLVNLSPSLLPYSSHFALGEVVAECCESLGRRAVFVASGDLSHRLLPGAAAGYSPRAREFDQAIADIVASGDLERIDDIDEELVEEAGECGFRSIHALRGALSHNGFSSRLLSYEGPFGVGYLVSFHQAKPEGSGA